MNMITTFFYFSQTVISKHPGLVGKIKVHTKINELNTLVNSFVTGWCNGMDDASAK